MGGFAAVKPANWLVCLYPLLQFASGLQTWAAVTALLSILLFALYGWDKRAAQAGRERIPEKVLNGLALFGGWPGALLGRPFFRHKTQKQPFTAILYICTIANIGAWLYVALGGSADEVFALAQRLGRF
ncbi:MAG: DUF1294 domain-containing protein [Neisseria sp.]|nr:DUF1294 domain-containing protein [Neisseria sp.]